MACFYPIRGWLSKVPSQRGKFPVVFDRSKAQLDAPASVPCGQCSGCRLERSRINAIRCLHESQMHDSNSFITLTYDDDHLPSGASLRKKHFQDFMKRLRFHVDKQFDKKIRFFGCGEYGENSDTSDLSTLGRPHYHAIIFGFDFPDKVLVARSGGFNHYDSEFLRSVWKKGHVDIGDVSFESAAYVARYCMKKITGKGDPARGIPSPEDHYRRIDRITGEVTFIEPEVCLRSMGIGKSWFDEFKNDLSKGFITVNGHKVRPPRYYLDKYEEIDPANKLFLNGNAGSHYAGLLDDDLGVHRLKAMESCTTSRINKLKRNL